MVGEPAGTITDADVRTLAAKLKGSHALLTPAEQTLLDTVLRRAAARTEPDAADTAGFGWEVTFKLFIYLDAIAIESGGGDAIARRLSRAQRTEIATDRPLNHRRAADSRPTQKGAHR